MLTAETNNHNFWSPYNKQFDRTKAEVIVNNFIYELTLMQNYIVISTNTDYMYNRIEKYDNKDIIAYFEGDYGSDSSTLIIREDNRGFLLLTNGID